MHPIDEVFTSGLRVCGGDGIRVVKDAGTVEIPSGRLLVADPMSLDNARPVTLLRPQRREG